MRCLGILILIGASISLAMASLMPIAKHPQLNGYEMHLKVLLQKILWAANVKRCFGVITDEQHYPIYDRVFFESVGRQVIPFFVMRTNASEDLQRPAKQVELFIKAIKSSDCELNVITILNGWQVQRFLGYIYDSRALNMQKKFVLLHDSRLFESDMIHLWSACIGAIFLKRQLDNKYTISTIAFPGILSGVLVMKKIADWELGKGVNGRILFADKTSNLYGASMPVAISEHVPMVLWANATQSFQGVEVEIMNALGKALNFKPLYYKPNQSETVNWELDGAAYGGGNPEQNGTHIDSMLVDEVADHSARFAIGDLHQFQVYLQLVELSAPHNFECLTFLTPESSTDNSWQTFILPFSAGMWAGVLLSLFVVGTVFYAISFLNALINGNVSAEFFRCLRRNRTVPMDPQIYRRVSFRIAISRYRPSKGDRIPRDLFDGYANCILLTYSMLLYVALPRMPRNWPLRVLTGWYWIYCILLVATYRASFTAILANPAARVTIDTLEELLRSHIPPSAGANENRQFFLDADDEIARKVGEKMKVIGYSDDLTSRIAKGQCAYYDNEFYLRYLRVTEESGSALHIMKECVLHMPVVLAMEKNSALKPRVDGSIQHLAEGLISKWLKDATQHLPAEALAQQEALMNIQKFWSSFVALFIGYVIAILALLAERWHFRHTVMKHPMYDVYNPSLYYNFKRIYPQH
ncbi:glutamate receptor ionotropic, delta-1 isoform X2 [Drosophila teissieri]|uniref:glutamate receptor ionotropic, delta-1 isoform X2 n=1 Tax=Drosophila teissieri TaxID=7243 RepID=UPI001CBA3F7C|nr:glutamate receptor ionotropic, delta-1 isoform X2 [Drosophila teissieri]